MKGRRNRLSVLVPAVLALSLQPATAQKHVPEGAHPATSDTAPTHQESVGERLRFFRWMEDYSNLPDDERDAHPLGVLKRIQLGW